MQNLTDPLLYLHKQKRRQSVIPNIMSVNIYIYIQTKHACQTTLYGSSSHCGSVYPLLSERYIQNSKVFQQIPHINYKSIFWLRFSQGILSKGHNYDKLSIRFHVIPHFCGNKSSLDQTAQKSCFLCLPSLCVRLQQLRQTSFLLFITRALFFIKEQMHHASQTF